MTKKSLLFSHFLVKIDINEWKGDVMICSRTKK